MIRRLNYTSRARIKRSEVAITFDTKTNPLSFNAQFNFENHTFEPTARVFVEAYRGNSFMRFDYGIVKNIETPSDCKLSEIEGSAFAKFRVKVVNEDTGKLVAVSSTLSPERDDDEGIQPEALLPLDLTDIGDQVWKVKIENEGVRLQLNRNIEGIDGVAKKDKGFRALVFPTVVREVLTHIIFVEKYQYDKEDEDSPWNKWVKFVDGFYSEEYPGPHEENSDEQNLIDWIDGAVEGFCSKHKIRDIYRENIHWRSLNG